MSKSPPCKQGCTCGKHKVLGHKCLENCICGRHNRPKPEIICAVYAILNTITQETYVGSSENAVHRIKYHHTAIINGNHERRKIREAVEQYGYEAFVLLVLEECSRDTLFSTEQFWFNYLEPEYNTIKDAAPHNLGTNMPEEMIILMSKRRRNQTPPMLGKKHSEEAKLLMSINKTGRKQSEERKLNQSIAMKAYWARKKAQL